MRRRGICSAFFFAGLIISSGWAHAADYEWFGGFDTQIISEPEPIQATLSDWGDQFDQGERQWAVGKLETGVRYSSGLELSIFSRVLADLRFNNDAVRFYGKISRKEPLNAGEQVPVRVRANGFVGHGARLGYLHKADQWSYSIGLSLFSTSRLISGGLNGEFTALSDSDYDFNADVDYVYYRDVIFKRPEVEPADGIGWALDMGGTWAVTDQFRLSGIIEDAFARVRWQDVPFTRAVASTDQKTFDDDGFAVFQPLLSGTEGYQSSFTQRLSPRYKFESAWKEQDVSLLLRGQYQFGYGFFGVGLGHAINSSTVYRAVYWPETKSLGLELSAGKWQLGVAVDQLDWSNARAVSISIGYGAKRTAF